RDAVDLSRGQGSGVRGQESGSAPLTSDSCEGEEGSPQLLAGSLDALARLYQTQGRLTEAEPLWREVLDCRAQALGEQHPLYADGLRCLAGLYQAQGDFTQAFRLQEQALGILRGTLGERHPEYVQAVVTLAELKWQANHLAEAEELYTRVVDTERERVGE